MMSRIILGLLMSLLFLHIVAGVTPPSLGYEEAMSDLEHNEKDHPGNCTWTNHKDWNYMNCQNHGYYCPGPRAGTDVCVCDKGWTGVDCGLCAGNSSCPGDQYCDTTFELTKYKAFNCSFPGNSLVPKSAVSSEWTFDMQIPANSHGEMSAYVHPQGAPLLFNCTFDECEVPVETSSSVSIKCHKSSCYCTEWCGLVLYNIVKGMTGDVSFDCDPKKGTCNINQDNLPIPIDLTCQVAGCTSAPYVPPKKDVNDLDILTTVLASVSCVLIIATCAIACFIIKRRQKRMYSLFDKKEQRASLSWHNISCFIAGRQVLHEISGVALPGQITAILGPSGAGKTTFIDILAGRKTTGIVKGDVYVNKEKRDKTFKRISGYVLQDDKLLGTLTVREHLGFVAQLRLPSSMPYSEKMERVTSVLEDLGISHIADSLIGTEMTRGISGGERKRVAIASELITHPSILFLDEPTSGLDSFNAHSLMNTLKRLAEAKRRTIVVSIHQPRSNIFLLFDNLLLLSRGEMTYYGSAADSIDHFAALGHQCPNHFNPADFLIDLVTDSTAAAIEDMATAFRRSHAETMHQLGEHEDRFLSGDSGTTEEGDSMRWEGDIQVKIEQAAPNPPPKDTREYLSSWPEQFTVLCKRTLMNNIRNPYLMRAQYILSVVLALLLGLIYWKVAPNIEGVQNRAGALFFMIALLGFGSMSAIDTFFQERALFVRERANGMYRTSSYFMAKVVADIVPMRVVPPLILGGISYYMIGLNPDPAHFLWLLLTLVLVCIVAASLCMAISAATPALSVGNLIAILLMLFYLLFGGFLVAKDSMPPAVNWFKWLSFFNYSFEILMVNELLGETLIFEPKGYNIKPVYVKGDVYLKQFDMDPTRFQFDFVALAVMIVFYLGLTYVLLRWVIKEKR